MDSGGMTGFPVRISLTFLIIALCTPSLVSAAQDFSQQADIGEMGDDLDRISDAAEKAYMGGVGTIVRTDIELVPGYELKLGGNDADRYSVKVMHGGEVVKNIYLAHPSVPILGEIVVDGSCTLCFECVNDSGYGVRVTVG